MQFIPTRSYFRFVRLSWKCVSLGELLPTSERALFLGAYTQWPCFTRFPWAAPVLSLRSALGIVLFSPFKQVLSLTDCVLTFMQIGTCSIFKRSPARIWRSLWESLPSVVVCCIHSRCLGLPRLSLCLLNPGSEWAGFPLPGKPSQDRICRRKCGSHLISFLSLSGQGSSLPAMQHPEKHCYIYIFGGGGFR